MADSLLREGQYVSLAGRVLGGVDLSDSMGEECNEE